MANATERARRRERKAQREALAVLVTGRIGKFDPDTKAIVRDPHAYLAVGNTLTLPTSPEGIEWPLGPREIAEAYRADRARRPEGGSS